MELNKVQRIYVANDMQANYWMEELDRELDKDKFSYGRYKGYDYVAKEDVQYIQILEVAE